MITTGWMAMTYTADQALEIWAFNPTGLLSDRARSWLGISHWEKATLREEVVAMPAEGRGRIYQFQVRH